MGAHMKTTIDITDALFDKARRAAVREKTTLRAVVERALRLALKFDRPGRSFRLRKASFRGKGLQTGVAEGDWERIRDLAYKGRGA
ncbi:MAG: hypothetical protein FD180_1302 [Planctomycetota bacterium]|nr:MAG: hypothetical protein FD180_1302 [Planctomycetota bacterium]